MAFRERYFRLERLGIEFVSGGTSGELAWDPFRSRMAERDDPSGRAQMAAGHLAEHHCWVASEDMRGLILETLADYAGVIGQVDPSSLVVRADRTSGACRLYDVTFLTDTDRSGSFLVGAVVDERGRLRPAGSAGGDGAPPTRERLWINLAGWWGGDESGAQLWAGGEVLVPARNACTMCCCGSPTVARCRTRPPLEWCYSSARVPRTSTPLRLSSEMTAGRSWPGTRPNRSSMRRARYGIALRGRRRTDRGWSRGSRMCCGRRGTMRRA